MKYSERVERIGGQVVAGERVNELHRGGRSGCRGGGFRVSKGAEAAVRVPAFMRSGSNLLW